MPDKAPNPFATLGGLDKALLRSTHQQSATSESPVEQPAPAAEAASQETMPASPEQVSKRPNKQSSKRTRNIDSNQANTIASDNASLLASKLAPQTGIIEIIRKAIKTPGKEVSFIRLTAEEKGQLADIVYTYKRRGKKTSENEINRIAINYILDDYKTNGEHSILASVIEALLA